MPLQKPSMTSAGGSSSDRSPIPSQAEYKAKSKRLSFFRSKNKETVQPTITRTQSTDASSATSISSGKRSSELSTPATTPGESSLRPLSISNTTNSSSKAVSSGQSISGPFSGSLADSAAQAALHTSASRGQASYPTPKLDLQEAPSLVLRNAIPALERAPPVSTSYLVEEKEWIFPTKIEDHRASQAIVYHPQDPPAYQPSDSRVLPGSGGPSRPDDEDVPAYSFDTPEDEQLAEVPHASESARRHLTHPQCTPDAEPTPSSSSSRVLSPPNYAPGRKDVPSSDINTAFTNLNLNSNEDLTRGHCIVHLKFLESLYQLRKRIAHHDGLFGIKNSMFDAAVPEDGTSRNELHALVAERRWAVYLTRAVDRFERWRESIAPRTKYMQHFDIDKKDRITRMLDLSECDEHLVITVDHLPPIDVLMVWHAYMLNPRAYLEDCIRENRMRLYHTEMPWEAINTAINDQTFDYRPTRAAQAFYAHLGGTSWDNESEQSEKIVSCPKCVMSNGVPWHEDGQHAKFSPTRYFKANFEHWADAGTGYADKGFSRCCIYCGFVMNHENLVVGKFLRHLRLLRESDIALPGTFLGNQGIPIAITLGSKTFPDLVNPKDMAFPNVLLKHMADYLRDPRTAQNLRTMADVRDRIEAELQNAETMRLVNARTRSRTLTSAQKLFIRRTMSSYWSNSSPFSIDLVSAVVRQSTFITKMHDLSWLTAPHLLQITSRALLRYTRFFTLLSGTTTSLCVPTLDIDLAWHTHQLRPRRYLSHSLLATGRFVDHDDKIPELSLSNAFILTSAAYQSRYKEPYAECLCWHCACTRDLLAGTFLSRHAVARATASLAPHAPGRGPHLSFHGVVAPPSLNDRYDDKVAKAKRRLRSAHESLEARGDRSRLVGVKGEEYGSDAYGVVVQVPSWTPFEDAELRCRGWDGGAYARDPGHVAGVGEAGACVAGTCSVGYGLAVGAAGAGSCASGSSGGGACGGGGSGSGGCGGGGGGCGGS
ncbi:hypothetical protein BDZ85DRAFT_294466 [Elsinoe ampelina]|uniref:Uncharacterized protein n=1 Tax=Elsinoe ampelina TaxID=302913 RepID=A0A6A6GKF1_9PEZI|nr:hypothetical protein BDZ85DRAFT_294466 [Elsinoe ampelina]